MSFSSLPLDVHHDIYSSNKNLYNILTTSRETDRITKRYLQPHINDNHAIRKSSKKITYHLRD